MRRSIIAVIVFAVALVAVPTVVALAQQPDSTATSCPYSGEGGMDHLAMHNQMSAMMGRMDMGQMSGVIGRMDMGQMPGMRPDVAR